MAESLEEQVTRLYDEVGKPLRRWLLTSGMAAQEAEEITQESFLRLYRHLHSGGGEENLRGWLYQVAHNLSVTSWKGRHRNVELTAEGWDLLAQSRPDEAFTPEEALLRKEKLKRVHQIMTRLTQLQRDCVSLRIAGFRYREMAKILGVSTSTVAGSLRNAITRLTKDCA